MSDAELETKFRHNAEGVLPKHRIDQLVDSVMRLEEVVNMQSLMALAAKPV